MSSLRKLLDNSLFYLFCLTTLVLYFAQPHNAEALQNTVGIYLFIAVAAVVLSLVTRTSLVDLAGLKPSKLTPLLILILLGVIVLSNSFLFWFKSNFDHAHYVLRPFSGILLMNKAFFSGTRTFGEELIFRGFLLLPYFSSNNNRFWNANLAQTIVFTSFHAMIPMPLIPKLFFVAFVITFSLGFGWLNRRFASLLPSWIAHWTNGALLSWIFMTVN